MDVLYNRYFKSYKIGIVIIIENVMYYYVNIIPDDRKNSEVSTAHNINSKINLIKKLIMNYNKKTIILKKFRK